MSVPPQNNRSQAQSRHSTERQNYSRKQSNSHKSRIYCSLCNSMFNNKQSKPQQICVNSHILCKSCFHNTRKVSCVCPFCNVKMNNKGRGNQNISLFLKAYNEYEQQKKTQEKTIKTRKNSFTQFSIPKYIKYLMAIFFIIMIPSILDLLKYLTDITIWIETKLYNLVFSEVKRVSGHVWNAVQDLYYLNFYQSQYMGTFDSTSDIDKNHDNLNSPNVQTVLNISNLCLFFYSKAISILQACIQFFYICFYWIHYVILVIVGLHFPFLIPIIIIRLQDIIPRRILFLRNRIYVYVELMHPQEPIQNLDEKDIQSLTKFQLYGMFLIRSYLRFVLKIYGDIEAEMKRKVQEVQYKKRMRLVRAPMNHKTNLRF